MRPLVQSAWLFLKTLWVPVTVFAAMIEDPVRWPRALGANYPDPAWLIPDQWRWTICFVVIVAWFFLWFHRSRLKFEASRPAKGDMHVHKAAQYIAQHSAWAATLSPDSDDDWPSAVSVQLLSALGSGRIEAWGRLKEPGEYYQAATLPIPIEDLKKAKWNCALFSLSEPLMKMTCGRRSYARVMLNKEQVEVEWPRRSFRKILGHWSPIDRMSLGVDGGGYRSLFALQDKNYAATPYTANFVEVLDR